MKQHVPEVSAASDEMRASLADRACRYDRDHARQLRTLAYRMLGSRADAEDAVQDAWLRWAEVDEATIEHTNAFLSRMVVNLCLDKLRSRAANREMYVGIWLPEPLLDDDELFKCVPGPEKQSEFAQDVSVAFMLVLERLKPLERAAFLLHDVFDMDHDEVARCLGRSEDACRQLSSRARRNIRASYSRREVALEERVRLLDAFIRALRSFDVTALAQVLTADAVAMSDGGGKVSAFSKPLCGNVVIATTFIGFARLPASRGWRLVPEKFNGLPGCLIIDDLADGRLIEAVVLAPAVREPGRAEAVYVQRNPDKLHAISNWLLRRMSQYARQFRPLDVSAESRYRPFTPIEESSR